MGTEKDADKMIKEAKGLCQPSVLNLRLKADWEQATPLYEKAALIYKQNKALAKAKEAYEKAAIGQERQGSNWHAAKDIEKAADIAKEMGVHTELPKLYRQAAEYYALESRLQAAADILSKGAKNVAENDSQVASEMYLEAVEYLETDGKGLSQDIFRQAIGNHIQAQRYEAAIGMTLRFAVACDEHEARNSQSKAYLSAVVLALYAGDGAMAWSTYQDALGLESFVSTEEAFAAEALMAAYRTADAEAVKKVVAEKYAFTSIDAQVSRLAKKLPTGDLQAISRQLGGTEEPLPAGHDLDEDDLT